MRVIVLNMRDSMSCQIVYGIDLDNNLQESMNNFWFFI
jgi:hypothetical protein